MSKALESIAIRFLSLSVLTAVAAMPATAQDSDMSSRMILELQQMREEVRELRGLVESQAQEIENLKRRQRDQYLDLDRRLSSLRGQDSGAGQPAGNTAGGSGESQPTPDRGPTRATSGNAGRQAESSDSGREGGTSSGPGRNVPAPSSELPEVREPSDEQPEVATLADPGEGAVRQLEEPGEAEQQAYDQAFRALRETRYADAAEGFDRFLRDHPRSSYAPNALYWLGEVYYVTRDFQTALDQFQRLQETYPESSKKPDALLKIGFSHYELGQWERARAALEQVIAEYPGTNYSRLAENRLRTMRLEGNL